MINKIVIFLSSMKFATVSLLIFAFSIAYATFIENDFGSSSSKALIYNSWWFEMILLLLAASLILNIFKYKLFRREKLATFAFHVSFILILIGAGITRYTGYEGMMRIHENQSQNIFLSDDTFLQIEVHDQENVYRFDKKLYLSGITKRFDDIPILKHLFSNYFFISNSELQQGFSIRYSDFLPNVVDSVIGKEISGINLSSSSVDDKHGTQISINEMTTKEILIGDNIIFNKMRFTVNNIQDSSVNFIIEDSKLKCMSNFDVSVTSMPPTGDPPLIYNKGEEFYVNPMSLLAVNSEKYMFSNFIFREDKELFSISNNMDDSDNNDNRTIDALVLDISAGDEIKEIILLGKKGSYPNTTTVSFGELHFSLSYGPKYYELPFFVRLKDAIVDRYPGTENASSYASEVIVEDGNLVFPFRIFMNNILTYRGYRFYQSNIDMENEAWTGLSVNHDMTGTIVTYIGYGLLMLGIIFVFLSKHTRMRSLSTQLRKLRSKSMIIILFLCSINSYSQDIEEEYVSSDKFQNQLENYKINIEHSNMFEKILIQDNGGRIKPIGTLASEYIRKISRKNNLFDNNASQILLGMMSNPEIWSQVPMIKVSHPEIQSIVNSREDRVPFSSFFQETSEDFNTFRPGPYKLEASVNLANSVIPSKRSKFQNELIKVNERVNIAYLIFNTRYHKSTLKMFPIKDDENNSWDYRIKLLHNQLPDSLGDISMINIYLSNVYASTINNDWEISNEMLNIISNYQKENGSAVIPKSYLKGVWYNKIVMEVWYNKLNIFSNLFMYYFSVGLILLILLFVSMFYNIYIIKALIKVFISLVILGFIIHILGLISRWIISGHAPWSNGYESMIYIAFATILSGVIFLKRSPFTLSATSIISSMILMVAHLNWLDPEITNLVPVLDSYWLMIHVSMITASYGFLACGALLGFLSLWLMIFTNKSNKKKFELKIEELTIINEKTITIGLFMLAIGTFLGGVWANESWGRYWGWDPKETWALVSILVYAFILHMRFIPSLRSKYLFNLMSLTGISSIIMTYFGVNYYLSGLHSYAAGDPMPIPNWIYYFISIVIFTAFLANDKARKIPKLFMRLIRWI